MGYTKIVKTNAYFSRFQPRFRRRREGKTDYQARRNLIAQAKNKYATPKYRLVVRFSNRDITAQIVSAAIDHDHIHCAAYAHELPRYGLEVGLTNYAAAYCVGLLIARRLLTKLGLHEIFTGYDEADGQEFHVEESDQAWNDEEKRPFKCVLDTGLHRTTTGAKVFAVMKGAVDGGLHIPHSMKRFPNPPEFELDEDAEREFDADALYMSISGGRVAEHMRLLEETNPAAYQRHFSRYIAKGIGADDLEGLYEATQERIRADPEPVKSTKEHKSEDYKKMFPLRRRMVYSQRKARIAQKLQELAKRAQQAGLQ